MNPKSITERIKSQARKLGFDLVGISAAEPHADIHFFDMWLQNGYAGTMEYLSRRRNDRADPKHLLENVKSIICCGLNYNGGQTKSQELEAAGRGWISRYAWGEDYHEVVLAKLKELEQFILAEIDSTAQLKSYVDTGPILERSYAASAGLGWIGKNTMLIDRKIGSYFFIGEILTSLELVPDTPKADHCGECRFCLDACPTEALTPYELDATRCISYLTIENRGDIAHDLQDKMGHHLVGCDICQEVCPWNQGAPLSKESDFQPQEGLFQPELSSLEKLSEEEYRQRFRHSAINRVKWAGMQRNVSIAKSNERKGVG